MVFSAPQGFYSVISDMKLNHLLLTGIVCCIIFSCHSSRRLVEDTSAPGSASPIKPASITAAKTIGSAKTDPLLENLLARYPQYFDSVLRFRDALRVQVIYTQINRDAKNSPEFTNYYFNVNPQQYFYPAST